MTTVLLDLFTSDTIIFFQDALNRTQVAKYKRKPRRLALDQV